MKQFTLLLIVFFISTIAMNAQYPNSTLHIESIDYSGAKKEIDAKCFLLSFVKLKTTYATIIIPKVFLDGSKEIKVFLNQEQKSEPLIITISIDDKYVMKSKNLVAIPYFVIRNRLENIDSVIEPSFVMEDFLPEIMIGFTEKDVDELKVVMEKQLIE